MIPKDTKAFVRDYNDPEWAEERPGIGNTYSGVLSGALSNPLYLLVVGVTLAVVGLALLTISPLLDGILLRVVGWLGLLLLVAGGIYFLLSSVAKKARMAEVQESEFKTESRDDYYPDLSGSGSGGTHYHEVIKVRCRYCGTLNEVAAANCIACGGAM